MSDVEIVIKIPEKVYKHILSMQFCIAGLRNDKTLLGEILKAIRTGTPLPKGHGKIADMDEAIKCIEEAKGEDAVWAISLIEWACSKRTIIEADSESEKI